MCGFMITIFVVRLVLPLIVIAIQSCVLCQIYTMFLVKCMYNEPVQCAPRSCYVFFYFSFRFVSITLNRSIKSNK